MGDTDIRTPRVETSRSGALLAGLVVGAFVLTSSLLATVPAFRFESQFPALLPFFALAGAAGVGHVGRSGRSLVAPWRAAGGLWSLAPYAVLMVVAAVSDGTVDAWWLAVAAAAAAMVPFGVLALRARRTPSSPAGTPDDSSMRGTFLIGVALILMAYAVSGPIFTGSILGVLLAVGLAVGSLMPEGMARAARTWTPAHWVALVSGMAVVWAGVLLRGMTSFFTDSWYQLVIVLLAGVPVVVVNARAARRGTASA